VTVANVAGTGPAEEGSVPDPLPDRATAGVIDTPFGQLAIVATTGAGDLAHHGDRQSQQPVVLASGFGPLADVMAAAEQTWTGAIDVGDVDDLPPEIVEGVRRWSSGADLSALDRVPVSIVTGGFRSQAWRALREVPAGSVVTYGELAEMAGAPAAARAAGTACATNRWAPFVPCHRVVPASGGVGSYGYGPASKAAMLAHEGARVVGPSPSRVHP